MNIRSYKKLINKSISELNGHYAYISNMISDEKLDNVPPTSTVIETLIRIMGPENTIKHLGQNLEFLKKYVVYLNDPDRDLKKPTLTYSEYLQVLIQQYSA